MDAPVRVISEEEGYRLEETQVPDGTMLELKVPILAEPSIELAHKGLREYGFEQRFTITSMSQMGGTNPIWVYSVPEIEASVELVPLIDFDQVQQKGFTYIDLPLLASWLEETVGDHELADGIRELLSQEEAFGKVLPFVKSLLQERVAAYRQCVADVKAEAVSSS